MEGQGFREYSCDVQDKVSLFILPVCYAYYFMITSKDEVKYFTCNTLKAINFKILISPYAF
jgi:hypothetical protein